MIAVRLFRGLRATHRLWLFFAATILVPGVLLGFFGLRALLYERRLADQQMRERLGAAAENVARRVALELPERLRQAAAEPGATVDLVGEGRQLQASPAGRLLYALGTLPESAPVLPPAVAEAESLELRVRNYAQAAASYRRALASLRGGGRAAALYRLARTLKKAGQEEEARRMFALVTKEPAVMVGSLPSDFLAAFEAGESPLAI